MKSLAIIPFLFLVACTQEPQTKVVSQAVDRQAIIIPKQPEPPNTSKVQFGVMDKAEMQEKFDDPNFNRIITLDDDEYRKLAYNTQELTRYGKEQKALILYYEGTIKKLDE